MDRNGVAAGFEARPHARLFSVFGAIVAAGAFASGVLVSFGTDQSLTVEELRRRVPLPGFTPPPAHRPSPGRQPATGGPFHQPSRLPFPTEWPTARPPVVPGLPTAWPTGQRSGLPRLPGHG